MKLGFKVTFMGGLTYVFEAALTDDQGMPVLGALVEYQIRRAAPGQPLPPSFEYAGADYTDANGKVGMTLTFDDSLLGYTDQWRTVSEGLVSQAWQFTVGQAATQVGAENLLVVAVPLGLALLFSVDWKKLVKR